MDSGLERELNTLYSERRMDDVIFKANQSRISESLNGQMGKDMLDVLNGKKRVELSKTEKIKNFFRRLRWNLGLAQ